MKNDATTNLFFAISGLMIVVCATLLVLFAGCGGGDDGHDDDNDCVVMGNCPDNDADQMMTDAMADPCAEYQPTGPWANGWDCGGDSDCNFSLLPGGNVCYATCRPSGAFTCPVNENMLAGLSFSCVAGGYTFTCYH